jgi:hypothetical protein
MFENFPKKNYLTSEEIERIKKANSAALDRAVLLLPSRCGNTYCQLPIPVNHNFRLLAIGDVCELCYVLYHILSESAYWNRVELEANSKKRTDDHYGSKGLMD